MPERTISESTVALLVAALALACTPDPGQAESSAESQSQTETQTDATSDSSSGSEESGGTTEPPTPDTSACGTSEGALLFGAPTANTGLSSEQCQPSCACSSGEWAPPSYAEPFLSMIEGLELLNPPALLPEDPYLVTPELMPDTTKVCAALIEGESYRLDSYASEDEAAAAGAWVTHAGACGQCSSLANLAVYMRRPDLTEPVRQCGLDGIIDGEQANIACLMALGFDEACAQIWYFNTVNTRTHCLDLCLAELDNPNHLPDGSLNPCIQCDEDQSGPVFKAVSGRTRRNSGLPSALCRPCDTVYRVVHDYGLRG